MAAEHESGPVRGRRSETRLDQVAAAGRGEQRGVGRDLADPDAAPMGGHHHVAEAVGEAPGCLGVRPFLLVGAEELLPGLAPPDLLDFRIFRKGSIRVAAVAKSGAVFRSPSPGRSRNS